MTRRLLRIALIALGTLLVGGQLAPASGYVQSIGGDGPAGDLYLMMVAPQNEPMNLRVFEFRRRYDDTSRPGHGERILTIKNVNGTMFLGSELLQYCWQSRDPGTGRSPNRKPTQIVQCNAEAIKQIDIEGSPFGDLICTIDPSGSEASVVFDVHAHGGNDSITGGTGDDELNGGAGRDLLRGRKGPDQLFGNEFPDDDRNHLPIANDGDFLWGEDGNDAIWGGPADDQIVGGTGTDLLCGSDPGEFPDRPTDFGCIDWNARDGANKLFSSEPRDIDLDSGIATPNPARFDTVDCGRGLQTNQVQYDGGGLDVMTYCPSLSASNPAPPQNQAPYLVPTQAAVVTGGRACPRTK